MENHVFEKIAKLKALPMYAQQSHHQLAMELLDPEMYAAKYLNYTHDATNCVNVRLQFCITCRNLGL